MSVFEENLWEDTFDSDGNLDFGPLSSPHRKMIYDARWQMFLSALEEEFPEYVFYFFEEELQMFYLFNLCLRIKFRDSGKLNSSLRISKMESLRQNEFLLLMHKFRKFLKFGNGVKKDLQKTFNQKPGNMHYRRY